MFHSFYSFLLIFASSNCRKVKHLIEEEILVLMDEDGNEHFLNGLETSLDSLITLMLESSGFKEFHSSISSVTFPFPFSFSSLLVSQRSFLALCLFSGCF